jgi:osmotically-inducible protein OsmY
MRGEIVMMLASDIQIREAVLHEIRWDPCIIVRVCGGTVTLSGSVDSPKRCLDAHEGAMRANGWKLFEFGPIIY